MPTDITDAQADATVVTAGGEAVGTVARVEESVAYVEPNPDAPDTLTATLGWDGRESGNDVDDAPYPLPRTAIDSVSEEEIRLRRGDSDVDRSDAESAHDADVTPAREAEDERTDEADEEAQAAARESEAEQEVEESIEREAAARDSSNPDAHRDEEPFDN